MSGNPTSIAGIPLPSDTPLFLALISLHVAAGLVCVIAGAVAMLSRKRPGHHPQAGTVYYWALATVFVTMAAIGVPRWSEDDHLVVLGVLAFLAATMGREARRRLWPNWARLHMTGMGVSYVLLLTAFYVDNGPNLPLWRLLPHLMLWLLPTAIAMPILIYALLRHPVVRRGTREPRA